MENESLTAELGRYKEPIKQFEERQNVNLSQREKLTDSQMDDMIRDRNAKFAAFQKESDTLKQDISKHVTEKESLSTNLTVFKTKSKEKEAKYIDKEIALEKKNTEPENTISKVFQSTQTLHMLTKPQVFFDNIHKQALGYQNPFYLKKAQWIKPTLYDGNVITRQHNVLNQLSDDFGKCFAPQMELSEEQAFWLQLSNPNSKKSVISQTPVKVEVPVELPITLKDIFNVFKKYLVNEITEVQTVFNQMEAAVEQCSLDKKGFEIQKKDFFLDTDRILAQIMSQDIVNIVVTSCAICESVNMNDCSVKSCNKCLKLEAELVKKRYD
ncbi:hypothetical protein Tco_1473171 [Tanacetum coccineum]